MLSKNESSAQETLDGVAVEYRTRTYGRLSLGRPLRQVNHAPGSSPDAGSARDRIQVRLPAQDLRCGDFISTREGEVLRLWVVEAITNGASDGSIEFTLGPRLP